MDIVRENLGIFSDKQQRHLRSDEWVLGATFGDDANVSSILEHGKMPEEQDIDTVARERRADSRDRSGDECQDSREEHREERREERRLERRLEQREVRPEERREQRRPAEAREGEPE